MASDSLDNHSCNFKLYLIRKNVNHSAIELEQIFTDIYSMDKKTSEIVSIIGTYLKVVSGEDIAPENIGLNITTQLIELHLVSDHFSIEVVSLNDTYMLRTRNLYTSNVIGAMPSFCKVCGKLIGKTPCTH